MFHGRMVGRHALIKASNYPVNGGAKRLHEVVREVEEVAAASVEQPEARREPS
jgi:hypothetical protein